MPKKRHPGSRRVAKTMRVSTHHETFGISKREGWLLVIQGSEVDLGRHIVCNKPIVIGRAPSADLPLSDGSTSRAHCSVERNPETGRYILIDLDSMNGTKLNGIPVSNRVPLSEGDKVFLGVSVVRFSFADKVDLQYHERIEEMATTDPLTGLLTKRQYDIVFTERAERALADHSPLALMVMDMDGLKQVNDNHGHEMGCYIIQEGARIIRDILSDHGTLCRFGGDEFVGCFPGLDRERATVFAQEVRDRIENHTFSQDGVVVNPTISIGLASYPDDTEQPSQLFAAADRALYKAKNLGRNRVATITQPPPMLVTQSKTSNN